jgi:NAD(P)-dependent dehydrogenase (short-subunit alcohol dehydrogenase family)
MSEARGVFITGGSRGIGRALVARFSAAGDRVAATSRTQAGADASGAELGLVADVADPQAVAESMARASATFGRLDVVIHNAGLAGDHGLSADDDAVFRAIVDVNLLGAWYVGRCAAAHLPDGGRLIFVGSTLSLRGVPDQPAYVAAKHGVLGLSRSLALRLAPRKITVNTLTPGWVRTDMAQQRADEIGVSVDALGAEVPLGRVAEPSEVADLAFFVASQSAALITGQALSLDGGITA